YLRLSGAFAASVAPDWAFSDSGALIMGLHGERPRGYSAAILSMPLYSPTPPPTSHGPPAAAPGPTATPSLVGSPLPTLSLSPTVVATPNVPPDGTGSSFGMDWRSWCGAGWCAGLAALPDWAVGGTALCLVAILAILTAILVRRQKRQRERLHLAAVRAETLRQTPAQDTARAHADATPQHPFQPP